MNKELFLKRFIQLLYECDSWIKYNSSDVTKYELYISSRAIFASYINKEDIATSHGYSFKTVLYRDARVTLPFINNISTSQLLKILLESLDKFYSSNLNTLVNDLNIKSIKDISIDSSFKSNLSVIVNVKFDSAIDRLKGLVNSCEYMSKSCRFINVL